MLIPATRWKIKQWVAQKRLRVPPNGNIDRLPFAWHPDGVAYWNPQQELNADVQAIKSCLATPEDVYMARTGRDWFADMLRRKEQFAFLADNGIVTDFELVPIFQMAQELEGNTSRQKRDLPKGFAV